MSSPEIITLETTIVAAGEQVSCDVGDETVVLNLKDGVYYGLNPVAASVWKNIQQERKVLEILDMLIMEYEVESGVCSKDLFKLLSQLMTWGLVETRNGKGQEHSSNES
jgi:hypothetical protein